MAACLVEISHNVTNQVRLMNPFDHEVQIEQHAVLGEAEPVLAEPVTLFSTINNSEAPLGYHHQIYRQILLL
jgi:hypothetical protein